MHSWKLIFTEAGDNLFGLLRDSAEITSFAIS